ncbi:hypothetical protein D3C78_1898980 [compost metagenome]
MGSIGFGGGGTNATASAGDQDDPVLEQIGAGGIIKHKNLNQSEYERPLRGPL